MNKILFLDTLTTGMSPIHCAIYRIGAIYTEDGIERKAIDLKMRPYSNARISQQSLWIGGETRTSLVHCPSEKDVFKEFTEFLDTCVNVRNAKDKIYIAGYNCAAYDIPFLREWFARMNNEQFRNYFHVQAIDMMSISAMALMDRRDEMHDFQMDSVATMLDIRTFYEDKYDCLANARTALQIYRKLMTRFGLGISNDESETEDIKRNFEK